VLTGDRAAELGVAITAHRSTVTYLSRAIADGGVRGSGFHGEGHGSDRERGGPVCHPPDEPPSTDRSVEQFGSPANQRARHARLPGSGKGVCRRARLPTRGRAVSRPYSRYVTAPIN